MMNMKAQGSENAARLVHWETRLFAEFFDKKLCLSAFFECLSSAQYIPSNVTKHMDIKPKNILVRSMQGNNLGYFMRYKVYTVDSSISRSYQTISESETESPPRSPKPVLLLRLLTSRGGA